MTWRCNFSGINERMETDHWFPIRASTPHAGCFSSAVAGSSVRGCDSPQDDFKGRSGSLVFRKRVSKMFSAGWEVGQHKDTV